MLAQLQIKWKTVSSLAGGEPGQKRGGAVAEVHCGRCECRGSSNGTTLRHPQRACAATRAPERAACCAAGGDSGGDELHSPGWAIRCGRHGMATWCRDSRAFCGRRRLPVAKAVSVGIPQPSARWFRRNARRKGQRSRSLAVAGQAGTALPSKYLQIAPLNWLRGRG